MPANRDIVLTPQHSAFDLLFDLPQPQVWQVGAAFLDIDRRKVKMRALILHVPGESSKLVKVVVSFQKDSQRESERN